MEAKFKKKSQIIDIGITAVAAVLSVGVMLYGVSHFGLGEAWPELVLNLCYIACLVMMGMYFFKRLDSQRFNYWSSVCAGITVLLRDILFPPPLESYPIHLVCLTLSVMLLLMFTYFYARKDWRRYTKRNLWLLFMPVILYCFSTLYHIISKFGISSKGRPAGTDALRSVRADAEQWIWA